MPINYKNYPPNWKTEIRPAILKRALNCCEFCGVKNYAVGYRQSGVFVPTAGNATHDAAGNGELSYKEARAIINHCNGMCDDNLIVIVLTIAHLDHNTCNNEYYNLRALCQQCHNRYDTEYRKTNRAFNRSKQLILEI